MRLFRRLCSGNALRSPVAEALLKEYRPELEVYSAGTNFTISPTRYNAHSNALKVVADIAMMYVHEDDIVQLRLGLGVRFVTVYPYVAIAVPATPTATAPPIPHGNAATASTVTVAVSVAVFPEPSKTVRVTV